MPSPAGSVTTALPVAVPKKGHFAQALALAQALTQTGKSGTHSPNKVHVQGNRMQDKWFQAPESRFLFVLLLFVFSGC